mmetsp:Transcript_144713/g.463742  ORF Transcript_144713/g.463742 Transcript_144713/m.463742 type:complete len:222 (-) Transcript_144713:936-1601(-)
MLKSAAIFTLAQADERLEARNGSTQPSQREDGHLQLLLPSGGRSEGHLWRGPAEAEGFLRWGVGHQHQLRARHGQDTKCGEEDPLLGRRGGPELERHRVCLPEGEETSWIRGCSAAESGLLVRASQGQPALGLRRLRRSRREGPPDLGLREEAAAAGGRPGREGWAERGWHRHALKGELRAHAEEDRSADPHRLPAFRHHCQRRASRPSEHEADNLARGRQ